MSETSHVFRALLGDVMGYEWTSFSCNSVLSRITQCDRCSTIPSFADEIRFFWPFVKRRDDATATAFGRTGNAERIGDRWLDFALISHRPRQLYTPQRNNLLSPPRARFHNRRRLIAAVMMLSGLRTLRYFHQQLSPTMDRTETLGRIGRNRNGRERPSARALTFRREPWYITSSTRIVVISMTTHCGIYPNILGF